MAFIKVQVLEVDGVELEDVEERVLNANDVQFNRPELQGQTIADVAVELKQIIDNANNLPIFTGYRYEENTSELTTDERNGILTPVTMTYPASGTLILNWYFEANIEHQQGLDFSIEQNGQEIVGPLLFSEIRNNYQPKSGMLEIAVTASDVFSFKFKNNKANKEIKVRNARLMAWRKI